MLDEWKEYWFPQEGKRIMLSKYIFVNAFIVLFFDKFQISLKIQLKF